MIAPHEEISTGLYSYISLFQITSSSLSNSALLGAYCKEIVQLICVCSYVFYGKRYINFYTHEQDSKVRQTDTMLQCSLLLVHLFSNILARSSILGNLE